MTEQQHFKDMARATPLPVTNEIASRVITLPLFDAMTEQQVRRVCSFMNAALIGTRSNDVAEPLLLAS